MISVEPEQVGLSSTRLQRLHAAMKRYVDEEKFAGIVTLLARRGQIAHLEAFGQRDREAGKPMGIDTIFRIYSMTKPVTTLAALMLYEEGHFQLDDPISDTIPAFARTKVFVRSGFDGMELTEQQHPITVHDLMVHTAGLSYGFFCDSPIEEMYRKLMHPTRYDGSLADFVADVAELPLLYQPGTAWRYSVATDVLGHLVERWADQPLGDFFAERILGPLGMTETDFHVPADKVDRFAAVYGPADYGGLKLVDGAADSRFTDPDCVHSGGSGLVSTAADYVRFCQMLLNKGEFDRERLVSRKTVELMTGNHLPLALLPYAVGANRMEGYGFGLGMRVVMDVAATKRLGSVGEYGWSGAANTYFWVDPVEEFIGIVMAQFMPANTHPLNADFRTLAYQSIDD